MSWETSDRRSRLPKDWAQRVAQVRDRAKNQCEAQQHAPDCDGIGRECDHIKAGDDHSLANLQWLSTPCHKAKTQRETHPPRRRGARRHPSEWVGDTPRTGPRKGPGA